MHVQLEPMLIILSLKFGEASIIDYTTAHHSVAPLLLCGIQPFASIHVLVFLSIGLHTWVMALQHVSASLLLI